jgi:hypothetical protein
MNRQSNGLYRRESASYVFIFRVRARDAGLKTAFICAGQDTDIKNKPVSNYISN